MKRILTVLAIFMLVIGGAAWAEGESLTLTMPENIYRPAEFNLSSQCTSPTDSYSNVRFEFTLTGPSDFAGDAGDYFVFTTTDSALGLQGINDVLVITANGVIEGYWGPENGFAMSVDYDITTTFTAEMTDAAPLGTYTVELNLVDIEEPGNPVTLASVSTEFVLSADTLYVGTGSVYDYQFISIQAAIDDAAAGDTIEVAAGTYNQALLINDFAGLTIHGTSTPVIQGGASMTTSFGDRDCIILVKASTDVTIEGFDIQGQGLTDKSYGVVYDGATGELTGCTVSPNTTGTYGDGVALWGDADLTVENCTIENYARVGVYAYGDNGCSGMIANSTIEGPAYNGTDDQLLSYGVEIDSLGAPVPNFEIRGNNIYNHYNGPADFGEWVSAGIVIDGFDHHYGDQDDSVVVIEYNNIHDNEDGIDLECNSASYAHFNNIYDNLGFGIYHRTYWESSYDCSGKTFDAENNWWGHASGPHHATTNPAGQGCEVSDNVDYEPWLLEEDGTETSDTESETITGSGTVEDTETGGDVTIDATGEHTITTAKYEDNPGGTTSFSASGEYYDVHLDDPDGVNSLTVEFCPVTASTIIYYWDGLDWQRASDQVYADGCIAVTITDSTQPCLDDLSGLPFASSEVTAGDINDDGYVNVLDVRICLQIVTGFIDGTTAQRAAADVDGDGDVDRDDAELLAEYIIGIEDKLGGD